MIRELEAFWEHLERDRAVTLQALDLVEDSDLPKQALGVDALRNFSDAVRTRTRVALDDLEPRGLSQVVGDPFFAALT